MTSRGPVDEVADVIGDAWSVFKTRTASVPCHDLLCHVLLRLRGPGNRAKRIKQKKKKEKNASYPGPSRVANDDYDDDVWDARVATTTKTEDEETRHACSTCRERVLHSHMRRVTTC